LLIETPYRNAALLAALLECLAPTTRVTVSCGLTLPEGWTRTDTVARWRAKPVQMPARLPAVMGLLAA
jgi:16S rRNA (cytidine1402-2'-O)-methyltransferase